MAKITFAGESLIAQKQGAKEALRIARFIFANVPDLDTTSEVDRAAAKPAAGQIVYSYDIPDKNTGYVNPNQVVYSAQIASDVGDWDFNWIGLESAEGVLFAVSYVPLQQKRRNIPPLQTGNNLTRNFLVMFDGAQALTGIKIDASTWQHDFTVRLAGIDERERLSNRDVYGRACFFGTALQMEKVGTAYQLKPGTAYIEGLRIVQAAALPVVPSALPTTIWLDVVLRRELNDVVASWTVAFGNNKADYIDAQGLKHYCVAIATLTIGGTLTDARSSVEPINGPLVQQFALRTGDYALLRARATTKEDVKLGNLPNAISDDPDTDSSVILATTKAIKTAITAVSTAISTAIANIVSGATIVGKAAKLSVARKITITGAVVGSTTFDGSADVALNTSIAIADETMAGLVRRSTAFEVVAGQDDATFVTPKKLRMGVSYSLGETGFVALPSWTGGLIIQWGYGTETASATDFRFFPIAFPTAATGMVAMANFVHGVSTWVFVQDRSKYLMGMGNDYANGSASAKLFWIAIGF